MQKKRREHRLKYHNNNEKLPKYCSVICHSDSEQKKVGVNRTQGREKKIKEQSRVERKVRV